MAENKYLVYIHTSPSDKKYVGLTHCTTAKRWNCGNGYKDSPHFLSAIRKYGWDSFSHEVVVKNLTLAEAASLEIMLIEFYETTNSEFGYNCSSGGESGGAGCVISDGTRAKISAAMKGRTLTAEHCAAISAARKGKTFTPEHRAAMSAALKGNQRGLGHKHTVEARAKMGKPQSAEHRANISKWQSKPVTQYLNGKEIARFKSAAAAAAAEITGYANGNISRCCTGKRKTAGGYSWAFTQRDTSIQKNEVGQPIWLSQSEN